MPVMPRTDKGWIGGSFEGYAIMMTSKLEASSVSLRVTAAQLLSLSPARARLSGSGSRPGPAWAWKIVTWKIVTYTGCDSDRF